jgi:transposase
LLFPSNIGARLSIDEVAVSCGELYTIVTNKEAKGKQGALVAIMEGTKADEISKVLDRVSETRRSIVKEITLDMSPSMNAICSRSFPYATKVIDRFHVQQLISEAIQEVRLVHRRIALGKENLAIVEAREKGLKHCPITYSNGDTAKQLLARSRYLLFKSSSSWKDSQRQRAAILFELYPEIRQAYELSRQFKTCFDKSRDKKTAVINLSTWYEDVDTSGLTPFIVAANSVKLHQDEILNYFIARSTNASAESFNAKLKGFRALTRGVTDKDFFLFRVAMLFG